MAPCTPLKQLQVSRTPSSAKKTISLAAHKRATPAPRRCRKCPHNPLRSQCTHTNAGRAYLKAKPLTPQGPLPPYSPLPPSSPPPPSSPSPCVSVPTYAMDLSNTVVTGPTPLPAVHTRGRPGVQLSASNPVHSRQSLYEMRPPGIIPMGLPLLPEVDPFTFDMAHPNGVPQPYSRQGAYTIGSLGTFPVALPPPSITDPLFSNVILPNGIPQANSGLDVHEARPDETSLVGLPLPPTPQARSLIPTTPEPTRVSSPAPSTPTVASEPLDLASPGSRQTRVTVGNPIYGFVEGAKQGNGPYAIVRTRQLRPAQLDAREAGKRFHRGMRDLIVRAENLSKETGAWIYIAGQHVNGAKGYTNYASPRLRRDAKKELTDIQNQFNTMTSALISSRCREAVDLSIALDKANKERHTAETTLAEFRAVLDSADADGVLSRDEFVAKLRGLVAGNGEPSES